MSKHYATFTFHSEDGTSDTIQTKPVWYGRCQRMTSKPRWWHVRIQVHVEDTVEDPSFDVLSKTLDIVFTSPNKEMMSVASKRINTKLNEVIPLGWRIVSGTATITILTE